LTGRPLVLAICLGQLGNLLPHVAVPAVMPQNLMPLWLSGAHQQTNNLALEPRIPKLLRDVGGR
jgi:hypothetical protein